MTGRSLVLSDDPQPPENLSSVPWSPGRTPTRDLRSSSVRTPGKVSAEVESTRRERPTPGVGFYWKETECETREGRSDEVRIVGGG